MPEPLAFDEDTAARLERLYLSADVRRRRTLATAALSPRPGERLADIGCGPGFHTAELSQAVGPGGVVIGIDTSEKMLELARNRNLGSGNVEFRAGDAVELPLSDRSVDGAVAMQVYEYVTDVRAALREAFRALRPGGRLVVVDIDWSTLSWHSTDAPRMRKVLTAWDDHLAHPTLPRTLAARMRAAGFTDVDVQGHVFVNTDNGPDGYSGSLAPLIANFAGSHGIPSAEAEDWMADLGELSAAGSYFFSLTLFVVTGIRACSQAADGRRRGVLASRGKAPG